MTAWLTTARAPEHRSALIAILLLVAAIVLGGGGSPNPATELYLQLLCVAAVFAWIWIPGAFRLPREKAIWLLAGLALILPVLHLIPLPPAIWQALPGRETQIAALKLVGAEDTWRPLSTSPSRTLASLLSIVPPVVLMLMVATLDTIERRWLIAALVGIVIVAALLGSAQLAGGDAAPRLYLASSESVVTGFQANRNAAVDVFLVGTAGVAALAAKSKTRSEVSSSRDRSIRMYAVAAAILVLASVMTASRAGVALVIPTLVACWFVAGRTAKMPNARTLLLTVLTGIAVITLGVIAIRHNTALQFVAGRFELLEDGRPELWRDTLYAIRQFWPYGSGIGTFVPNFIALEPLEAVDLTVPNRAHNDYLELTLEGGVAGLLVLILTIALLSNMVIRAWRIHEMNRYQLLFSATVLMIIAAHSIVDYPMRSMSLASLAALAAGLLARPRPSEPAGPSEKRGQSDTAL